MFTFDCNEPQMYELAQLRQAAIRKELAAMRREAAEARLVTADEAAVRRFKRLYLIRHWMNRLAPRLARAWML